MYTVNQAASGVEVVFVFFLSLCHHVFCSASASVRQTRGKSKKRGFDTLTSVGEGMTCGYYLKKNNSNKR